MPHASNPRVPIARKALPLPAVLACMLLAGCFSDEVTSAPTDLARARSVAGNVVDRPFAGDCDLVSRGVTFTGPTTAMQIVDGSCTLTHLGRSSVLITENIDFIASSYSSVVVFTAANGDELRTTLNGVATPGSDGLNLAGTMIITGGSGRFANASGTVAQTGLVPNSVTARATYHLDGRLSY